MRLIYSSFDAKLCIAIPLRSSIIIGTATAEDRAIAVTNRDTSLISALAAGATSDIVAESTNGFDPPQSSHSSRDCSVLKCTASVPTTPGIMTQG